MMVISFPLRIVFFLHINVFVYFLSLLFLLSTPLRLGCLYIFYKTFYQSKYEIVIKVLCKYILYSIL